MFRHVVNIRPIRDAGKSFGFCSRLDGYRDGLGKQYPYARPAASSYPVLVDFRITVHDTYNRLSDALRFESAH